MKTRCKQCIYAKKEATVYLCCKCGEIRMVNKEINHFVDSRNLMEGE